MARPYVDIPDYPEPGQARAFADRDREISKLYNAIVNAGNALRAGNKAVRHRHVVHGYMGVGKSSVIFEALAMIRGESTRTAPRAPVDPQRWIVIRVSGKNAPSMDALADVLAAKVKEEDAPQAPNPLLSLLEGTVQEAREAIPSATIPSTIFHRLFSREKDLYAGVKAALRATVDAIERVKEWQGGVRTKELSLATSNEANTQTSADASASLEAQENIPTAEAKAGLKLAASYLRKRGNAVSTREDFQQRSRVDAGMIVEFLNKFFDTTRAAQLPTILVIDDLDEVTSATGPSFEDRAKILFNILAPLRELAPTCLIFGLREEYKHEDILRGIEATPITPMPREVAGDLLEVWGKAQAPALSPEELGEFKKIKDIFLEKFDPKDRVLIPLRFLRFAKWLNNGDSVFDEIHSEASLLSSYFEQHFGPEISESAVRLARAMPSDHIPHCAAARPLDPAPYSITGQERHALERAGILRPAMAGDPHDNRIVIDPMVAYLRVAIGA